MMNNYGYYDPTKTLITSCPNCGARPQARVWSRLAVQAMSVYSPTAQPGIWGTYTSAIHPLICSHCGLVEFFTDPRNFHAETDGVVKEASYTAENES